MDEQTRALHDIHLIQLNRTHKLIDIRTHTGRSQICEPMHTNAHKYALLQRVTGHIRNLVKMTCTDGCERKQTNCCSLLE